VSDLLRILGRDDAAFGEHRRMRLAGGDVLPVKLAVDVDRGVDLLHQRIGLLAEAPAPHFVGHGSASARSSAKSVSRR
jgi:hypothetical protein